LIAFQMTFKNDSTRIWDPFSAQSFTWAPLA